MDFTSATLPTGTSANLAEDRRRCATKVLTMYRKANVGHIGSSLSCLEILVDLCFFRMQREDILILSKGHAACSLYVTLGLSGKMDPALLDTFYKDGTFLAAHPPCGGQIAAIPFGTGSLGHGLGLACGIALSQKFTKKSFHVYAILSDGDCQEGSTFEAAQFAAHHKLSNLTTIIDANGIQAFGHTREILDLEPLDRRWDSLGFNVQTATDGNNFADLDMAYRGLADKDGAKCLIARTTKGHGVSFMEHEMPWHYLPMNDDQFAQALAETSLLGKK